MEITAILTGYNRPHTLKPQIDALKNQTYPVKDIMLWYNQGEIKKADLSNENIKIIDCNHNFKFHGRFALGLLAQTEYVMIFDDDMIPGKRWIEHSVNLMKNQNGIYGSVGCELRGPRYMGHMYWGWSGTPPKEVKEVDLVGHTWFMKRECLKYLWYEDPIDWNNGEDIQLSYLAQKYGNIKSFCVSYPEDEEFWPNIKKWHHVGGDEQASFIKFGYNYLTERDIIVNIAVSNGWDLLYMRK